MGEGLTRRCGDGGSAKQSWIYHGTNTGAAGMLVGVSVRAAKRFRDQLITVTDKFPGLLVPPERMCKLQQQESELTSWEPSLL